MVEFVKSSQPTATVFVKDIDTITDDASIEYAIGVGVATQMLSVQGYTAIETHDLIEDILQDNKYFDARQLIENTFPRLLKGNAYVPVYKYLRAENLLTKSGAWNSGAGSKFKLKFNLRPNAPQCFLPQAVYAKKQHEIRRNHKDIHSITSSFDKEHSLNYIPLLDFRAAEFRASELGNLLVFLRSCQGDEKLGKSTAFRKLVCFYDYYKYGVQ